MKNPALTGIYIPTTPEEEFLSSLDPKISRYVKILRDNGIHTTESCEGGEGHCFPEPTIRFRGSISEGHKAVAVAIDNGFPMIELRRVWHFIENEMVGPEWDIILVASRLER